ncbi:hypothetical protein GCM10027590_57850 [Nocardiopsis nanhaiensis]
MGRFVRCKRTAVGTSASSMARSDTGGVGEDMTTIYYKCNSKLCPPTEGSTLRERKAWPAQVKHPEASITNVVASCWMYLHEVSTEGS